MPYDLSQLVRHVSSGVQMGSAPIPGLQAGSLTISFGADPLEQEIEERFRRLEQLLAALTPPTYVWRMARSDSRNGAARRRLNALERIERLLEAYQEGELDSELHPPSWMR